MATIKFSKLEPGEFFHDTCFIYIKLDEYSYRALFDWVTNKPVLTNDVRVVNFNDDGDFDTITMSNNDVIMSLSGLTTFNLLTPGNRFTTTISDKQFVKLNCPNNSAYNIKTFDISIFHPTTKVVLIK